MNEQQGFPNIGAPIAGPGGRIEQAWLQLLITLWTRTGQATGNVGVPTGTIQPFAASSEPSGYLPCDGAAVSRTQFANLYGVIGETWGAGDGVSTFNVPDLRGRFLIGAGGAYTVAQTGGAASLTLTTPQLPAHNHGVTDPGHTHTFTGTPHTHTITDPGHVHTSLVASSTNTAGAAAGTGVAGDTGSATTGITINNATAGGTNASATTGVTTTNTGTGAAIDIRPPFAGVTYIIKF